MRGNRRRRSKVTHRPNRDERIAGGQRAVVYREPGEIDAPVKFVKFHFWAQNTITNLGNAYTNNRYSPNNPYDVDPLVGSTAIPGLTEEAAIYTGMRVVKYSYVVEICNNEAFPVTAYAIPSLAPGTDPGANALIGLDYPMNPRAKSFILSAKGGQDRCVFKGRVPLPSIQSNQLLTDDSYASSTAASVAAGYRLYFVSGALSGSSVFTAAGVTISSHFYMDTQLFNEKDLST